MLRNLLVLAVLTAAACTDGNGEPTDVAPHDVNDGGHGRDASDASADVPLDVDSGMPDGSSGDAAPDGAADGAGDVAPEDAPGPADVDSYQPPALLAPWVGRILIHEGYVPNQGPFGSTVHVAFTDVSAATLHELVAASGQCRYYSLHPETPCSPECKPDEQCTYDGRCMPWPQPLSGGEVTLTGLKVPVTVAWNEGGWYEIEPDTLADLFDPGDTIDVSVTGGAMPAFEAQVKGVADMDPGWTGELQMEPGKPLLLSWPPEGRGGESLGRDADGARPPGSSRWPSRYLPTRGWVSCTMPLSG